MSPLGPVAYGDNRDHIFLGREISREQNYSEETAKKIDLEILKIVTDEKERARYILSEKHHLLEKLADALLQYETVEGRSVYELVQTGGFQTELEMPKPPQDPSGDGDSTNDMADKKDQKEQDSGVTYDDTPVEKKEEEDKEKTETISSEKDTSESKHL
jgi:cell division protease FtsH